jgi:hypothetical protein
VSHNLLQREMHSFSSFFTLLPTLRPSIFVDMNLHSNLIRPSLYSIKNGNPFTSLRVALVKVRLHHFPRSVSASPFPFLISHTVSIKWFLLSHFTHKPVTVVYYSLL